MGLFKKREKKIKGTENATSSTTSESLLSNNDDIFVTPNKVICTVLEPMRWLLEESMKTRGDFTITDAIADLPSSTVFTTIEDGNPPISAPASNSLSASSSFRRKGRKVPVTCSLRVEILDQDSRLIRCSHGTSEAFSGLDDKDELVRTFQRCRCEHLEISPPSRLVNWDVTKEECINVVGNDMPTLSTVKNSSSENAIAVLKEPMGSGGTGIFFVQTAEEIHNIVQDHRIRAVEEPNFLDNLIATKGRIPSWVLQAEVQPCLLIRNHRKFHIRSYVLGIEDWDSDQMIDIFVYKRHEVRIASDPVPANSENLSARSRNAHITNAAGNPNIDRDLMENIPEISNLQSKVETFVAKVLSEHLIQDISRRVAMSIGETETQDCQKFVLAGVDLMMTEDHRIYLLEVNVDPTIPTPEILSPAFRDHLTTLMGDIVDTVVGKTSPNFVSSHNLLR